MHMPDCREHLIRYYSRYSILSQGERNAIDTS